MIDTFVVVIIIIIIIIVNECIGLVWIEINI